MLLGAVRVAQRRLIYPLFRIDDLDHPPNGCAPYPNRSFRKIRTLAVAAPWQYAGLPPDQLIGRLSTLYHARETKFRQLVPKCPRFNSERS